MLILAVFGSARRQSTNLALLQALQFIAPVGVTLQIFDGIKQLPVFSPDDEEGALPDSVRAFKQRVAACDGLLISSPEYARGIPGGLKNAIDWLVSGDEVADKPIALVHASHRGDDMLAALRLVVSTVSSRFAHDLFFCLPVMSRTPEAIREIMTTPGQRSLAEEFLQAFARYCAGNHVPNGTITEQ